MSTKEQNLHQVKTKGNSAKNLFEKAKREVPLFTDQIVKFEHQITNNNYSNSTIFSYTRAIAKIS